ncbi:MAG: hypothetical protein FJ006_13490 [Chloroflexi bacterium]|nr:hypothetical protein [Chloroflexota bacterium]
MDGFTLAAFVCYLVTIVFALYVGFMYLLKPRFFAYHEWVLGKKWEELDLKLQTLILAFMKGIGGAIIALGLAILAMTFFAFLSGDMWSYFAIPLVSLIGWGIWLYLMLFERGKTGAKAPLFVPITGIALILVGSILSLFQ